MIGGRQMLNQHLKEPFTPSDALSATQSTKAVIWFRPYSLIG